eukprot:5085006-Heterocapsa_arctica.AAC.1
MFGKSNSLTLERYQGWNSKFQTTGARLRLSRSSRRNCFVADHDPHHTPDEQLVLPPSTFIQLVHARVRRTVIQPLEVVQVVDANHIVLVNIVLSGRPLWGSSLF